MIDPVLPVYTLPKQLRTQRLLLRPVRLTDAQAMFDYASDPQMTRFVTWPVHRTLDDTYRFLSNVVRQYELGPVTTWGIVDNSTNVFIGTIGCHGIDRDNLRTEAGYAIARAHWGRGLMTEALRAWIDMMFRHTDLNRIEAFYTPENCASGRVMEKAGMSFEGFLRQCRIVKQRTIDLKLYAILRSDWEAMTRR